MKYNRISYWHAMLGRIFIIFIFIVAITTIFLEFPIPTYNGKSKPILDIQLSEPIKPGSVDQAMRVAELATGVKLKALFIRSKDDIKFSEAGDGIGGKSVFVDPNTMKVTKIVDWTNWGDALVFILHDGRWMGGMNAFNINDITALVILFLTVTGWVIYIRKIRNR
jgi:uncharacterized iron-regulated membrane protein